MNTLCIYRMFDSKGSKSLNLRKKAGVKFNALFILLE